MLKIKILWIILLVSAASVQMQAQKGWEWAFEIPDSVVNIATQVQSGRILAQVQRKELRPEEFKEDVTDIFFDGWDKRDKPTVLWLPHHAKNLQIDLDTSNLAINVIPIFKPKKNEVMITGAHFGKKGGVNAKGKMVIPFVFQNLDRFSKIGLARFERDWRYGFINKRGRVVIKPRFEAAYSFHGKLAWVCKQGKWGLINRMGCWVLRPRFESAGFYFQEGFSQVYEGGKYGFINKRGKLVIATQYEETNQFSEGLVGVRQAGKWGFINKKGEWVIQPQFELVDNFREGLAEASQAGKWGFINKKGEWVIQPQFEAAGNFREDLAEASQAGKWGFINKKGEWVIQPQFEAAGNFREGLAEAKQAGKWGFINKKGEWVIQPKSGNSRWFNNDYFVVGNSYGWSYTISSAMRVDKTRNKITYEPFAEWGFMDTTGAWSISPQFVAANDFNTSNKTAKFIENNRVGLIDTNGKIILPPLYEDANKLSDNFFKIKINNRWGVVNAAGKLLLECKCAEFYYGIPDSLCRIGRAHGDFVAVYQHEEKKFIDVNGNWVEESAVGELKDAVIGNTKPSLEPLAKKFSVYRWLSLKQRYGFSDENGKILLKPQFDKVDDFSEGYALVQKNGKYGFVDAKGELVVEPQFDYANKVSGGLAFVYWKSKFGFIRIKP
jgi:hypothetical protein